MAKRLMDWIFLTVVWGGGGLLIAFLLLLVVTLINVAAGRIPPPYSMETELADCTIHVTLVQTHSFFALYRAEMQVSKGNKIIANKEFSLSSTREEASLQVFRKGDQLMVLNEHKKGFVLVVPTGEIQDVDADTTPKKLLEKRVGRFAFVDEWLGTRYRWVAADGGVK